jgi:hypothetical protein
MSAVEEVLAQLGRQKWAIDSRDADALRALYTAGSAQLIYRGGPAGRTEIDRRRGREEIIDAIVAGWERSANTWYLGAMIHQIGSQVIEPLGEGRIRCRSYASFLGLDPSGAAALMGYGTYDDVWTLDDGEWRLAERETVLYGHEPPRR